MSRERPDSWKGSTPSIPRVVSMMMRMTSEVLVARSTVVLSYLAIRTWAMAFVVPFTPVTGIFFCLSLELDIWGSRCAAGWPCSFYPWILSVFGLKHKSWIPRDEWTCSSHGTRSASRLLLKTKKKSVLFEWNRATQQPDAWHAVKFGSRTQDIGPNSRELFVSICFVSAYIT